ncbi:hypothetical protein AAG570_011309 [Ranatra chinensis]|uniref:Uncharacterized protein n=1 Tax=Ranatra chinensis TaxID=642074 RepID=A0ABD0YK90_9HEMI
MSCAIEPAHPLQLHEENYSMMDEKMGMKLLREVQGLHAPLKLATEIRATKLIGHLPFLQCSKLSFATVKGLDDVIDFTDILNPVDLFEKNIVPHVAMEA